jgi:hypothetical protein
MHEDRSGPDRSPHDHDHGHHHYHHHHGSGRSHGGLGHNGLKQVTQWQVPHLPEGAALADPARRDIDLVEESFIACFGPAPDPTSFLRLTGIPFVGENKEGQRLHLLRVEISESTDVGSAVPMLGGQKMRYDPLPSKLTSRRRRLAFHYHDGQSVQRVDFATARSLIDRSEASEFSVQAADH